MNASKQIIGVLSAQKPRQEERIVPGMMVKFGGGSIHGPVRGKITRMFRNGNVSVLAKVRGVDKTFHPHIDDLEVITEMAMDCPECDGTGKVDGEDCEECDGTGKVDSDDYDQGD